MYLYKFTHIWLNQEPTNQPKVNVSKPEVFLILSKIYLQISIKLINVSFLYHMYHIHIQHFLLPTNSERGARYKRRDRRTVTSSPPPEPRESATRVIML